jgi:hypothetical protein
MLLFNFSINLFPNLLMIFNLNLLYLFLQGLNYLFRRLSDDWLGNVIYFFWCFFLFFGNNFLFDGNDGLNEF